MHTMHKYSDWGLLALRLALGAVFLYHGSQKWGLWSAAPEGMDSSTLMLMKFLSVVEPLGGLALVLGVLTQWAALGLAIIMVGAIYFKMNVMGVGFAEQQGTGWEFDLVILAGLIMLWLRGAGTYALDRMMGHSHP